MNYRTSDRRYQTRADAAAAVRALCPNASKSLTDRLTELCWSKQYRPGTALSALAMVGIDCEGYEVSP